MNDHAQRIHRIARHQHVQLHHRRHPVACQMIVERSIPARAGLQPVVKIQHDLVQRQLVFQQHAPAADVLEFLLLAALLFEQTQDAAQILLARDHGRQNDRLFHLLNPGRIGELSRVIDLDQFAVCGRHTIAHAGRGSDQVDIEFALQALLHDLQVQQAQEAAAKAEAQRHGAFGLEIEGAVVKPQLFQRIAQQPVLVRFDRIQPREYHGLDLFKSGQRLGGRIVMIDDGIADLGIGNGLDVGEYEANFAGGKLVAGSGFGRLVAQPFHLQHLGTGRTRPQPDALSLAQAPIHHARQDDDAAVRIEPGIENQGAQRRFGQPARRRH